MKAAIPSFWSSKANREWNSLRSIATTLAREDYHPPLHYVILHFWMKVAGQSEFALRYVSVCAGVLAVAAAWTAAKRIFDRGAAPIAAVIFGFAPYLWDYTREARKFSLVPLFTTLAIYFCTRAAQDGRRPS